MVCELISKDLLNEIKKNFNLNFVYEIRLRLNNPVVVNYAGKNYFCKSSLQNDYLICKKQDIDYCLEIATQNSIYAYNNQIKQGFITCKNGIRLGLAGEHVLDNSNLTQTIKNITSLNIRIPHEVKNCAHTALSFMLTNGVLNTLIIAPPGAGKTTFLRDIASSLSKHKKTDTLNVLIVDERFEIANESDQNFLLDIGQTCDVISGATKEYAFSQGIRTLKPDVVITDELVSKADAFAVKQAILAGVKVVATIHGKDEKSILNNKDFKFLLEENLFERIIILSNRNGPGTYEKILNENLKIIYQNN